MRTWPIKVLKAGVLYYRTSKVHSLNVITIANTNQAATAANYIQITEARTHTYIHLGFISSENNLGANISVHTMLLQRTLTNNVNTSPHSPYHKVCRSSEVQATSCFTCRGNILSPSPWPATSPSPSAPFAITPQDRAPEVSGLLYDINSNYWLCMRVSHVLLKLQMHKTHR